MSSQQEHLTHPKYRPDIDGLRAIAILSVVIFHAFTEYLRGGFVGVDVFFVISGYLISTIVFENCAKGTFSFVEFYSRRVRRIFPALILVITASLAFGWFALLADEYKQLGKHVAGGASFLANLVLYNEVGYFDNAAETKPLLHLWSLGVEEQFYIMFPPMVWLAFKYRYSVQRLLIILAIMSFLLNVLLVKIDQPIAFYMPQTRFWELLSGGMLAWLKLRNFSICFQEDTKGHYLLGLVKTVTPTLFNRKVLTNLTSLLGLLLLVLSFSYIQKDEFPGYIALLPVSGTLLIILAGHDAWVNKNLLSNKVVVWFGLVSYPLYLWHWPLLSFSRIVEGETPTIGVRSGSLAAGVFLAWLTYKFIERPIRLSAKRNIRMLVLLMITVGCVGYYNFMRDGLLFRPTSQNCNSVSIKRECAAQQLATSLAWYRGKDDWLFLGNSYDNTVSKLKLSTTPDNNLIEATKEIFSELANAGSKSNTKIVLIVGPNKSTVYPEYLPDDVVPSPKRYISFFLEKLKFIPNLVIYDPTSDFIELKKTEGFIYWMTDTHWNNKGAFLAYSGFSKLLRLPVPEVKFHNGSTHSGDLIKISGLNDVELHPEDNWDPVWEDKPKLESEEILAEQKTNSSYTAIVTNKNPLSNNYIWVVGDSFSDALRQYFNATFREVRYVGHWKNKLSSPS